MTPTNEIRLRPTRIYAFFHVFFLTLATVALMLLSVWMSPVFVWPALAAAIIAACRFALINSIQYTITHEIIRIQKGILMKRTDQVEMYRIKDYIILQPLLFQAFGLMNLILKTTDPENPLLNIMGIPRSDLVDTIRDAVQKARNINKIVEIN